MHNSRVAWQHPQKPVFDACMAWHLLCGPGWGCSLKCISLHTTSAWWDGGQRSIPAGLAMLQIPTASALQKIKKVNFGDTTSPELQEPPFWAGYHRILTTQKVFFFFFFKSNIIINHFIAIEFKISDTQILVGIWWTHSSESSVTWSSDVSLHAIQKSLVS